MREEQRPIQTGQLAQIQFFPQLHLLVVVTAVKFQPQAGTEDLVVAVDQAQAEEVGVQATHHLHLLLREITEAQVRHRAEAVAEVVQHPLEVQLVQVRAVRVVMEQPQLFLEFLRLTQVAEVVEILMLEE